MVKTRGNASNRKFLRQIIAVDAMINGFLQAAVEFIFALIFLLGFNGSSGQQIILHCLPDSALGWLFEVLKKDGFFYHRVWLRGSLERPLFF